MGAAVPKMAPKGGNAPKRVSRVPKDETKEARFQRLANPRVNKALKALTHVGNLAGPGYGYTAEQAQRILDALDTRLSAVRDSFLKPAKGKAESFTV